MELSECNLCKERKYGHGPVPGVGSLEVEICLLGRNPGVDEDRIGRPFVGKAGGKLNDGLIIAKCPRSICRVDNVVKCMTPKDVKPSQQCQRMCSATWLKATLRNMPNLKLVVTLGNEALHYFETLASVGELHGTLLTIHRNWLHNDVDIFCSYHPSAALRSTIMDKHFVRDMEKLGRYLQENKLIAQAM